jgi:hypothetical protein
LLLVCDKVLTNPTLWCCPHPASFDAPQKQRVDPQQQQQQQAAKRASKTVSGLEIEQQTSQVAGIMSSTTFDSLELSGPTAQGIADMNFSHMTEVQVCDTWGQAGGAGSVTGALLALGKRPWGMLRR